MSLRIREFHDSDIPMVKQLTDIEIGDNYFNFLELRQMQRQSLRAGMNASFVLTDGQQIHGIRLSFPQGNWLGGKGNRLSDHLWDFSMADTAYFQSLFIRKQFQGQGWGKKLSIKSMDILKAMGAKGIVCHSWVESPGNSSLKYLQSLGFKSIASYPEYWKMVDYKCPLCGKPCLCTAEEMYLNLEKI